MEATSSVTNSVSIKQCGQCGATDKKLQRCGRCKIEYYCDRSCQKSHWPKHKVVCAIQTKVEGAKTAMQEAFLARYREQYLASSTPSKAPKLSPEQEKDAAKLISIQPLDAILDQGEVEAQCKALGQQFFDKYKKAAGGDSLAGKQAVIAICNSIKFSCKDGPLRRQYIEKAWNGIGDEHWDWRG